MTPSELSYARVWLIADGLDLVDAASLDYNEVSHLIELNYPGGLTALIHNMVVNGSHF